MIGKDRQIEGMGTGYAPRRRPRMCFTRTAQRVVVVVVVVVAGWHARDRN
jgi:hypothetical protein